MSELLTDAEVSVLNAARLVLAGIGKRAESPSDGGSVSDMSRGRIAEVADRAGAGIFHLLNTASAYGSCNLTYEQLHMRTDSSAT
jgi:hypothetical protein